MKQVINRPIGPAPRSHARPLWQWLIGLALSAGVVALAVGSREWLLEAMAWRATRTWAGCWPRWA